jgi:hypothetical protein
LAVNFDLIVGRKHEPALLHARVGVSAEFGAVVVVAGDADLDDKFGGVGVLLPEVLFASTDHGEVGFGL